MLRVRGRSPDSGWDPWLISHGWQQVEAAEIDPDLADWALPPGTWPGQVQTRFDGVSGGRVGTIQQWSIRRRLGPLPYTRTEAREVIAVAAAAGAQPVILRPRALVRRSDPPVWPGADEVQSRDVFIAGGHAVLKSAVPALRSLLTKVKQNGAIVAVSASQVVVSAPAGGQVEELIGRLDLAVQLAEVMEQIEPG